jgi:hypothetical protein
VQAPTNAQVNLALQVPGLLAIITGGTLTGAGCSYAQGKPSGYIYKWVTGAGVVFTTGTYFTTGTAPFELANEITTVARSTNPTELQRFQSNLSTIDATATEFVARFYVTLGAIQLQV